MRSALSYRLILKQGSPFKNDHNQEIFLMDTLHRILMVLWKKYIMNVMQTLKAYRKI